MEDQAKMERLLRLLMMLSSGVKHTRQEIQSRTNISERSFYRYLNTIENAGFILDRTDGHYSLQDNETLQSLNKLLHFSEEEAFVFYQTLDNLNVPDTRKEPLLRKLNALYDFKALANARQKNLFEIIQKLNDAIQQKKQALLTSYRSSNSSTIRNRIIEPIEFTSGYYDIKCIDTEDGKCKQFKIERIGLVTILTHACKNCYEPEKEFYDAFRISAPRPMATVKAELSIRAYNLLIEEFPSAANHILPLDDNIYFLEIPIASFDGIGRFILGLPGEIHVLEPQELIGHLLNKVKANSFCSSFLRNFSPSLPEVDSR